MNFRRLCKTLGLTAMAVVALCALAGAAQAKSWTVNHAVMSSATSFTHSGSAVIKVPARGLQLNCNVSGTGTATPSSTLSGELGLWGCAAVLLSNPNTPIPCTATWLNNGKFEGTAESATLSAMTVELTGAECALPKKNELKGITLSLSYGPEFKLLAVSGSGSGTFGTGANPATLAMTSQWHVGSTEWGNTPWGYGEPLHTGAGNFYANGSLLSGTATISRYGTMTIELPTRWFISCGETAVGEINSSGLLLIEASLTNCKLRHFETTCTIAPTSYTNKSELLLIKASGAECPLAKEAFYTVPTFSYAYGPEAVNLANAASGTGKYGSITTYWESSTTWQYSGAHAGQTLGFH